MRLEISVPEVQKFLDNQFCLDIELKYSEEDKIEAKYFSTVALIIKGVKEEVVSIQYEANGLANMVTKFAHFFLKKKLDNTPIEWDSKNKEVTIDLNKITELSAFLKHVYISEIHFTKETIVLEMYARGKS